MRHSPCVMLVLMMPAAMIQGPPAHAQVDLPPALPAPSLPPVPEVSPLPPGTSPLGRSEPAPVADAGPDSTDLLLQRMQRLEREVEDVKALRQRVAELESELESFKGGRGPEQAAPPSSGTFVMPHGSIPIEHRSFGELYGGHQAGSGASSGSGRQQSSGGGQGGDGSGGSSDGSNPTAGYSNSSGEGTFSAGGGGGGGSSSGGSSGSGGGQGSVGRGQRVGQREPLKVDLKGSYRYNFAGGFFQFSDEDGEFVLNVQNIITADGTFYDRQNAPTEWKGFNIPYQRLYLYGNITKNWEYQVSEQTSLGDISLLDLIVNVHYDDRLMVKFGRFLAPFYYQDYATFPMLVPAISYSPLSQFSAQRQPGVMAWGKLLQNRLQYQSGVFTGIPAGFVDLDDNVDFISSLTVTPFMATEMEDLQNLGFGVSTQVGWQNYMLDAFDVPTVIAGTNVPNLNRQYVTASNVPFFSYRDDVRALGERIRVAPHLFYYGRFSFLGEYVYQSRELASPAARGTSIQHGFYVTGSYFLTGERYTGDGTGGFPTIMPNRPFNPSNNEYGIGAHELGFQYSLLNVDQNDIRRGFADPEWATRLNEVMLAYNWWPNKYVRLSVNWVHDEFNRPIPWPVSQPDQGNGARTNPIQNFNVVWFRVAMFF
ncbi:porin [Tautonia sp. JC769]|uniref:porin n=1 Tax=Tautonia sp. JC769 TaxID=3232135 RepID=UPI003459433E